MKFKIILFVLSIFLIVECKAQENNSLPSSTVYFIRSSGTMGLNAFSTFIDDSLACHLNNNRYSIHLVKPGIHKFQVRADGKMPKKNIQSLEINLTQGKQYYFLIEVTAHVIVGSISLLEITENMAKKIMTSLKEDTKCQ